MERYCAPSGEDMRFIGVFSKSDDQIFDLDLEEIDKTIDYNGFHAFLKNHPEFNLDK